jgi:hypothetical protein
MMGAIRAGFTAGVRAGLLLLAVLAGCTPGGGGQIPAAGADARAVGPEVHASLLVQGRIGPDDVTIEPIFRIDTGTHQAARTLGPHLLVGFDRDGALLFEQAFETTAVAGGPEEHYSMVVKLEGPRAERLHRVKVRAADGRSAIRTASMTAEAFAQALAREDAVRAERMGDGRVRLRWDSSVFFFAMVRNPDTGTVLAIGRGGEIVVLTELDVLDVVLSEGIRSGILHLGVQ